MERRDKERRVDLTDYPALNYRQKRLLLEDLAYWMIKNNWSQVALELVDERFERKLKDMPGIVQNISGSGVRRLFVERHACPATEHNPEPFPAVMAALPQLPHGSAAPGVLVRLPEAYPMRRRSALIHLGRTSD